MPLRKLGFRWERDPELEAVSELIDDHEINQIYWRYHPPAKRGRKPYFPSQYVRMHLLLLLKRFSSYNQLYRETKKRKAFRKFCKLKNKHCVPAPSRLSEFRKSLIIKGPGGGDFTILVDYLRSVLLKAKELGILKESLIAVPDSTDLPATCNGFGKKVCSCPGKCDCPREYTAKGAKKGHRSKKSGKSPYFVGYKKHTLKVILPELGKVISLCSITAPANEPDGSFYLPLLGRAVEGSGLTIAAVCGDLGYCSQELKRESRQRYGAPLVTGVKSNTVFSELFNPNGNPTCEEGIRLEFLEYDPSTQELIYKGTEECNSCPLMGTCPREFAFPCHLHETLLCPIPYHTELSLRLRKKIRPLSEPTFSEEKHIFNLAHVQMKSLDFAAVLSDLADICKVLKVMAGFKQNKGKVRYTRTRPGSIQLELPLAA